MSSPFSLSTPSTKREKQLLLIAGILAFLVVVPLLYSLYGGTSATVFVKRNALRNEVKELEKTVQKKEAIQKKLTEYLSQSLPPMVQTRDKYMQRLDALAKECGFQNSNVNPVAATRSSKSSGYQPFSYKLTGTVSLEGLTNLLKQVYEAEVLQLIKTIAIKPVDQSNRMDITMDIEAIALDSAKKSSTINWSINSDEDFQQLLGDQVRRVNERALFSVYKPPAPEQVAPPPPKEPDFTEAMHTFVNTIVDVNGVYEVWLDRRLKGDRLKLKVGDHFVLDGVDCVLKDIMFDRITIEAAGEEGDDEETRFSVRMGKCFNDFE